MKSAFGDKVQCPSIGKSGDFLPDPDSLPPIITALRRATSTAPNQVLLLLLAQEAPSLLPWPSPQHTLSLQPGPGLVCLRLHKLFVSPPEPGLPLRPGSADASRTSTGPRASCPGLVAGVLTCGMGRLEALPLDGVVGVEAQEHAAARGHDRLGLLAATEAAQNWGLGVTPVVHLQVVVGTLGLGLNVHLQEGLGRGSRRTVS